MTLKLTHITISKDTPLTLICGPCVIESRDLAMQSAEVLKKLSEEIGFQLVYKSSFDKANRSNVSSYRGPGLEKGLEILREVKETFSLDIMTDIHMPEQAAAASEVCDILQIPAFLCRQTDLPLAAADTTSVVNIKKGQFVAPWDIYQAVDKARTKTKKVMLTERGYSFGYNNLVSDMRAIPIMQKTGCLVCFDATHSVQLPGGGITSGGQREFIPTLAKSAIAAGADLLYMEAHPDPENAKSDASSQIAFSDLKDLLTKLNRLYEVVKTC